MSDTPRKRARTSSVYECRACLMKISDDSCCVDIFRAWDSSWSGMGASIAQDLVKLSNVQICASDPHSKNICKTCCSRLQEALDFTLSVQKNDLLLRKRHRESSNECPMWPKPIQVDKNITANTLNAMAVEVKEEVLTDDENEINETSSEMIEPNLDIKIEPEEMTPAAIPSIESEVNCPLSHPGPEDQEVKTNGATVIHDEKTLFKIVETIEKRQKKLRIVPSSWEKNGQLRLPNKRIDINRYIKNKNSKSFLDWYTLQCVVKRTSLPSYSQAEKELELVEQNIDTDIERTENTNCNLNVLAEHLRLLGAVKEEPMSEDEFEPAADMPKDCMLCLETFNTVKGLKAHVIAVHSYNTFTSPRAERINVCTKCNRSFATYEELSIHKIGHSDFKCYICDKKFATFILLIKHKDKCKPTSELTRLETLEDVKRTIPVYYIMDKTPSRVKENNPKPDSNKDLDSEVAGTKEALSSVEKLSVLEPLDSGSCKTKQENQPLEPSASGHLTDNETPTVEKVTSTQNPILEGNQLSKTTVKKPDKVSSDDETNLSPNIKSEVLQAEEYTQKQEESVDTDTAVIADSESKQTTDFKQVEEPFDTSHSIKIALESKSNNDTEGSNKVQDNRSKVSKKTKENETEDSYKENEQEVYKMDDITSEESISEVCNKTKIHCIKTLETTLDVDSHESNKMDDIKSQETNKREDCNKTKGHVINNLETTFNEDSPESKKIDDFTSKDSNIPEVGNITKGITTLNKDSCASKANENKVEVSQLQSLETCNNITNVSKQIDTTEVKQNLSNEDSKPMLSKLRVENLETQCPQESMEIQLEIQSIDEDDAMDIDNDLRIEIKASSESDKHT